MLPSGCSCRCPSRFVHTYNIDIVINSSITNLSCQNTCAHNGCVGRI